VAGHGHLHHLELYVSDLAAAVDFWGWLLSDLGWECYQEWDEGCSYRHGDTALVLVQAPEGADALDRRSSGLNHLAFRAESEAEVDRITEEFRSRHVRILYPDRHPFAGGTDHYAVFCEDPDGLKVEIVAPST
jgi:catechol 2,3-dioxygenase-like lactoylglutathione lyase family enzyme